MPCVLSYACNPHSYSLCSYAVPQLDSSLQLVLEIASDPLGNSQRGLADLGTLWPSTEEIAATDIWDSGERDRSLPEIALILL